MRKRQHRSSATSRGRLVAKALAGAWRRLPVAMPLSIEELEEIKSLLLETGSAALCWWRIRHSGLPNTEPLLKLQQAYRIHTIQAISHESIIKQAINCLRRVGVEPLLTKGWAVARLYPELGLRPYVDIDLCVRPIEYQTAVAALAKSDLPTQLIDLHPGIPELDDRNLEQLYYRSQQVRLDNLEIQVIGVEDHLRFLSLHLMRHGAWRPLWLCDIGILLELQQDFDWEYCFSGNQWRSDLLAGTIGLAQLLLDAQPYEMPSTIAKRIKLLPGWLTPAVLKQWGSVYLHREPCIDYYLKHPREIFDGLRRRWPNPVEATVARQASFNELPRLVFQLSEFGARAVNLFTRKVSFL
ncbi:MAG: nucleotidyltransferase family protein [Acidobacteriota bacterium]